MRVMICTAAAACLLVFASAARADTTYGFTLNYMSGSLGSALGGGSGSFEINQAPSGALSDYISSNTAGDILEALSFNIDGQTFNLSDGTGGYGEVEFRQNPTTLAQVVDDVAYNGSLGSGDLRLTLVSGQLSYTLYSDSNAVLAKGTIGGIAPTPEPSSLVLIGTGLVGAYGLLRRRRKLV